MSRCRSFLFVLLLPLSLIYAAIQRLRVIAYRLGIFKSHRLPGMVISIGNLELGGTGKSPIVIEVCRYLLSSGARPAILTRGYRSGLESKDSLVLQGSEMLLAPRSSSPVHADEARMQAMQLKSVPVIVGSRRFLAARRFLEHFPAPTHWILDDGFQHLRIQRDLDLVLLDAKRPLDSGYCIPGGRLREPPSALARASALIFTRADEGFPTDAELISINRWHLPVFRARFCDGSPMLVAGEAKNPNEYLQKNWILALGLARPERVEQSLEKSGLSLVFRHMVRDHERFDFTLLRSWAPRADALLTSEKDFWRSPESFIELGIPVYVLPLQVSWPDPESLPKIFNSFTHH